MAETPRLQPQRITPCPRCIGGKLVARYGQMTCVNCGYDWTPTPTVPLAKPERTTVLMSTLRCVVCGDVFRGKQATAKYCSTVCNQQAKRARGVLREVGS